MRYKSCVLKTVNNGRVFDNNLMWEDFYRKDFIDYCIDIPYIGYIQSLEADFLIYEYIDKKILDNYDIIIFLSNSNEKLSYNHPDKKIFIIPCEPYDNLVYEKNSQNIIINNYTYNNLSNHLTLPYVYDLGYFSQFKTTKKNKIFKQKRSDYIDINGFEFFEEKYGKRSYRDYFKELSECKYSYINCKTLSPGQMIAESSIMDVITFSLSQKIMAKILLPEFCIVENVTEIPEKIKMLENDNNLYDNIISEIKNNVNNNLSLENFKKNIYEKIYSNDND